MRIDAGGKVQISSFWALLFNPVAQAKFVHTVGAGYVTGTLFVLSISAYYLLKGRHKALAQRSVIVASAFGLASSLCVIVLGDESGYNVSEKPEDEARDDRRHVEDGTRARQPDDLRHPRFGKEGNAVRGQGSLGARPDRNTLVQREDARHR
jgi:hypothetical protein